MPPCSLVDIFGSSHPPRGCSAHLPRDAAPNYFARYSNRSPGARTPMRPICLGSSRGRQEVTEMAKADIAALLALGAVIHQRSAHEVTDEPVSHLELFSRLLHDGRWWLGSLVAAAGFALQA